MREGATTESQREKIVETKGGPFKNKTRNRQFNVISRTKIQKYITFTNTKIYYIYTKIYITYIQVPGYVNRYWNCLYIRKNYPPSYVNRYRGQNP